MRLPPRDRIGALLLALAFGIGLPSVQGGMMVAEMAVSTEPGHPGSHGCGDDGAAAIEAGLSMCAAAYQCVLPE